MKNPMSKAVWGAVVALVLLGPTSAGASSGQSGKLDRALQLVTSSGEARDVIIRVKAGRKTAVKNKVARGTSHFQVHGMIDAISARLDGRQIAEFAQDPDVEGISVNADVSALGAGDSDVVSDVKQTLGLSNWFTGSSLTVAVIDSGIAPDTDFDSRILAQYQFSAGKLGVLTSKFDDYGHGTHVAGLIGSNGSSSNNKYAGVAPGAKILALKVLDRNGSGKTSDVLNALDFVVANKVRFNIKIVNLSLGHPIYESAKTDPLVQAVEAAVRAGLIVVVAAGNYGYNPDTGMTGFAGIASPGNAPSAITVGAAVTHNTTTRTDDRLANYSSRGPSWYDGIAKPDVLAPGQGLVSNDATGSTLEKQYPALVVKSGRQKFMRLSGSSMATGVVSGLVAVMIETNDYAAQQRWTAAQSLLPRSLRTAFTPRPMTSNTIKALLQYSATPLRDAAGVIYGPLEQGAGMVNGHGAIELSYHLDTMKPAGGYWMTAESQPFTNFGGVNEPWSQTVLWGTRRLRGTSVIDLRQAAWEDNIVWGTGELDNIVSGTFSADEDNIVWGTLVSEDNIVWGTNVSLATDLTWAGNAALEDNIVWGTAMVWDDQIIWGANLVGFFSEDNIVWGTCSGDEDNIVWGTLSEDNIVWGTSANRVTVLGTTIGGGL
jgi:serine protease AprX